MFCAGGRAAGVGSAVDGEGGIFKLNSRRASLPSERSLLGRRSLPSEDDVHEAIRVAGGEDGWHGVGTPRHLEREPLRFPLPAVAPLPASPSAMEGKTS
jgi:hypothetical protein